MSNKITLTDVIKEGGEGTVYNIKENPNLVYKKYREEDQNGEKIKTDALFNKLKYMSTNPPQGLIDEQIIAWPISLCFESGKPQDVSSFDGFVMPRLNFDMHLAEAYGYKHPTIDKSDYSQYVSIKKRIKLALNLCSLLDQIHNHNKGKGYIIGDFNDENIGVVSSTAQIVLMDCDSFHLSHELGSNGRCNVVKPGYLAPEIIEHCSKERAAKKNSKLDTVELPTFTKESDNFCLAVHIFCLLMNGISPYNGVRAGEIVGSNNEPLLGHEAVKRFEYVFRSGKKPASVLCPPKDVLPSKISNYFDLAFIEGRENPSKRPTAEQWYHALREYLHALKQCSRNEKHQYYDALNECPWCEVDRKKGWAEGIIPSQPDPPPKTNLLLWLGIVVIILLGVPLLSAMIFGSGESESESESDIYPTVTQIAPAPQPISSYSYATSSYESRTFSIPVDIASPPLVVEYQFTPKYYGRKETELIEPGMPSEDSWLRVRILNEAGKVIDEGGYGRLPGEKSGLGNLEGKISTYRSGKYTVEVKYNDMMGKFSF